MIRPALATLSTLLLCFLTCFGQSDSAKHEPAKQQPSAAQEQADEPTLKVEVNVVNIFFTVQDKQGGLVPGLTKDDFTVFEDGKQQTIRYFNKESDLPITMGLLIDVSPSQGNLIDIEKQAASQFFNSVLRQKDLAFLISFGGSADLLQDYTSSPKLLRAGLNDLKVNASGGSPIMDGPVPT